MPREAKDPGHNIIQMWRFHRHWPIDRVARRAIVVVWQIYAASRVANAYRWPSAFSRNRWGAPGWAGQPPTAPRQYAEGGWGCSQQCLVAPHYLVNSSVNCGGQSQKHPIRKILTATIAQAWGPQKMNSSGEKKNTTDRTCLCMDSTSLVFRLQKVLSTRALFLTTPFHKSGEPGPRAMRRP